VYTINISAVIYANTGRYLT